MRRWIRSKAALGTLAATACLATWLCVRAADTPEAREIKAQLLQQAKRIKSLDVSYKLETRSDLKPEQLLALADYRNQLFLPVDSWREAVKGDMRYRRQIQPERVQWLAATDAYGLVPPQEPNPNDPEPIRTNQKKLKEQYDKAIANMKAAEAHVGHVRRKDAGRRDLMERDVTRGFNGRSLWVKRPMTEKIDEFQTWPADSRANFFGFSAYQSAIGMQALDPTARDASLAKVLQAFRVAEWVNDRSYTLEEKTEVIDGATCMILKGNWNSLLQPAMMVGDLGDRIWLDRDHGLAVRKRELTRDGRIRERHENSALREVEPGLWLPTSIKHSRFAADAPAEFKDKPVLTEEIRVESIEINKVPDDLFDMPVPRKGDRIEDLRGIIPAKPK